MANNKKDRADHDDVALPDALEGLRDQPFVTYTANTNDILKEIRVTDNKVHLIFTRKIHEHSTGEVLSVTNVRESHDLADIQDQLVRNINVLAVAAKIKGSASITRDSFFTQPPNG